MSISFSVFKKRPIVWLYSGGALLLLVGTGLWWAKLCTDPQRVFWDTARQSLATQSVTIEAEQANDGMTMHQTLQYALGADNLSHSLTTLTQKGTNVVNEVVGTPQVDYTRYVHIQTDQKGADGKALDFSKIVGVWAKGEAGSGRLFAQAILGTALPLGGVAMPIGNLSHGDRERLIAHMHKAGVYKVDFGKVKKQRKGGRLLYTYNVAVQPVAYAALMKRFAGVVGLEGLEQVDPNQYKDSDPLQLQMTIDVYAHQIVQASLPDSDYKQTYTSYDIPAAVRLPRQTIPATELQERLSKLH